MSKKVKILLLEDSPEDAELLCIELRRSNLDFSIEVVDDKVNFVNAILNNPPDVVLSDHSLPSFNSVEALKIARENIQDIPFILVTGTVSEEFAVTCIKSGADDYILKGNLSRLPSAILEAIKKRQTEKERDEAIEKLNDKIAELNLFMYKATHDLRGPLTSIMGLTRLALGEGENIVDYLKMIDQSTVKLDAVLLGLIRVLEIRRNEVQLSEIDFKHLIDLNLAKLSISNSNFRKMTFLIDESSKRTIYSDKTVIDSILKNCIENSIQYHNQAAAAPFVSVKLFEKDKMDIIEIEDNGTGIDDAMQAKVFDMFYKGSLSSVGSGLGLYIVKCGVESLGGSITLKSEKNKGTRISIALPSLH